jgi:hypothetical protein
MLKCLYQEQWKLVKWTPWEGVTHTEKIHEDWLWTEFGNEKPGVFDLWPKASNNRETRRETKTQVGRTMENKLRSGANWYRVENQGDKGNCSGTRQRISQTHKMESWESKNSAASIIILLFALLPLRQDSTPLSEMQLEPLLNRQFRRGRLWTLCATCFVAAETEAVPPARGNR